MVITAQKNIQQLQISSEMLQISFRRHEIIMAFHLPKTRNLVQGHVLCTLYCVLCTAHCVLLRIFCVVYCVHNIVYCVLALCTGTVHCVLCIL